MKIEIITIGDEILIGQITDTNSSWMAEQLSSIGTEIVAITSVADQAQSITHAIDIAFSRADVLLLTGGIGPTKDDITKNTLCKYFNTHLIHDSSVLDNIEKLFTHRNIPINHLTQNQAMVPESAKVIQNKTGTAPILWFQKDNKILVSMPGVPFEMKSAMTHDILPALSSINGADNFQSNTLLVSGIPESELAIILEEFENSLPSGTSLAYLPSYGLIRLRLSIRNSKNGDNLHLLTQNLKQLVTPYLIDDIDRPIEELLNIMLKSKNLTLSIAESCTGGNIAHRITQVPGASATFKGGIVTYSNEAKENLLHVNSHDIEIHGAVSQQVVEQMALGCANALRTNCSIAVSGIAGPTGGSIDKPVGTTWICTIYNNVKISRKYNFGTTRRENITRATNAAILQMIKMLAN